MKTERTADGEAGVGGHDVHEAVVDGRAALTNPEGAWREVLARGDVRDRWASESVDEPFSEVDSERVSAFLSSYGARPTDANGGSWSFVDPSVR